MPIQYSQVATYERVLIIYAIVSSTPFDMATVIRDQTTRCITDSAVRSWFFPVLVTMDCAKANVRFVPADLQETISCPWSLQGLAREPPPREEPPEITGIRKKHFTKQQKYIMNYIHRLAVRQEEMLRHIHDKTGCESDCPKPQGPPPHPFEGMNP
ncbi:OLC1v1012342C1 [Oldenlandia corymbosa var. corymbosa]|uniref:OLC1v1012342C1 n=1 Tax=Oldenlandia corymbosa var. corymbosa TaxID=529605 RepID=A0AAV1DVS6_OLDCO|nr:OLC1v1012342C1 [Oldenlandia corymbosa var. corymbosa]